MPSDNQVFFRTDEAWDIASSADRPQLPTIDVSEEAKALRFVTSARKIDAFAEKHTTEMRPYTLFGSGDFHHLSAVWMRQFREPFTLLSFDNHPDWDVRPPDWSCGAWINRALQMPRVRSVAVFGCGSFECSFPSRLLGNRAAARTHRLLVYPWLKPHTHYPLYLNPMTAETWRTQFHEWAEGQHGHKVYVTVDMDCLAFREAATNWENGRFTCDDLTWALRTLRESAEVVGGDLCGAWSRPQYQTSFQKIAGWFDHPSSVAPAPEILQRNLETYGRLWPALTGAVAKT